MVAKMMGSLNNIVIGLMSNCRTEKFESEYISPFEIYRLLPVRLRSLSASFFSKTGPNVSIDVSVCHLSFNEIPKKSSE